MKLAWSAVLAVIWMVLAVPAVAHHSYTVDYDDSKPIKIKGVVTKVEWTNPHPQVYLDVTDANGKVTNWNFQLTGNRSSLTRLGWNGKTLKVGDVVTMEGLHARLDVPRGIAKAVILANGKSLFGGDAADSPAPGR